MPANHPTQAPFLPGQYMADSSGASSDADRTGQQWVGQEFWFDDIDYSASGARGTRSSIKRLLRVVRNKSGAIIPPKRLVVLEANNSDNVSGTTDTAGPGGFYNVGGIARSTKVKCHPVDEYIPTSGVPTNALFYIVVKGPAVIKKALANTSADIAVGDLVYGALTATTAAVTNGSTAGGRLQDVISLNTTELTATDYNVIIGTAMSLVVTNSTDSDVLVNVGVL